MHSYLSSEYIVLIEDSRADVNLFCTVMELQQISLKVEVFSYGKAALEFLANPTVLQPRSIITDVMLPDISGIELLRQLNTLPRMKGVPVFVWSSGQSDRDRASCEQFCATYLEKPMNLPEWEDSLAFMLR
jgi:CheY-like chemotaxis protein